MSSFSITAQLVDIQQERIYPATVHVADGKIVSIDELAEPGEGLPYLLPPLVDAHVHIESSMLLPTEFARMAVIHGTVATVSDPHEIGNVLGVEGVKFMIENGKRSPFKFCFGAPPCVPATTFETAGATIGPADIETLLAMPEVGYLAEVMNFPGVLNQDLDMMAKIAIAKRLGKPVDGHAPGLRADAAKQYAAAGISTDHECFTLEEALDKIEAGMKILIREGSAAKNFEALYSLLDSHPDKIMLCSDDKHPDELAKGHINELLARAVAKGISPFAAIRAGSKHPIEHYQLPVGQLREGDPADFITVHDLTSFEVIGTWIDGQQVASKGESLLPRVDSEKPNKFSCSSVTSEQLKVSGQGKKLDVIVADDGQIVTRRQHFDIEASPDGAIKEDLSRDLLKLVVVNRYFDAPPAVAFVHGFNLKAGALASSVAHDSHNILAVGTSDDEIARAIELVRAEKGGVSFTREGQDLILPLPIAGLMSDLDGWAVAAAYEKLDKAAKEAGCTLSAPYMTLSFLALLVIPELKLSDKGLFDGNTFSFTPLVID